MSKIPNTFKKIFVAGGISSINDLRYLWSFPRVIPQLGSAFWKNRLSLGEIYCEMLLFDENGKVPATIQDDSGLVKATVYMNREEIKKCLDERTFKNNRVLHVAENCDNSSLLIITDSEMKFCSNGNYSCYPTQNPTKTGLRIIADHIKSKAKSSSYSGKMQQNPEIALTKLIV
jgi:phosphoribosyl-AMP cyclohydrolase